MTTPRRGVEPLPVPDWSRPGETWRVEPEDGGWYLTRGDGVCSSRGCFRSAVAIRPARTYRGLDFAICGEHLTAGCMWIENGQVVSWCLRP
jgi:hypothetical protein